MKIHFYILVILIVILFFKIIKYIYNLKSIGKEIIIYYEDHNILIEPLFPLEAKIIKLTRINLCYYFEVNLKKPFYYHNNEINTIYIKERLMGKIIGLSNTSEIYISIKKDGKQNELEIIAWGSLWSDNFDF